MLKKGGSSGGGGGGGGGSGGSGGSGGVYNYVFAGAGAGGSASEKSPPMSPKETSPRDSDSDEHTLGGAQHVELKTALVHFRRLIADQSDLFTREVKLQLGVELIEEFCNEASTKEESKQALSAVKNVTHCAAKLQKKIKREKRKNKQQTRKGTLGGGEKADNNGDNGDMLSIEKDEPSRTSLSLDKKPSLMDMLEFLRSSSSTGNEGPSPSILSQFERKQRSDTQDSGSTPQPQSSSQDSSLATVTKKNSLIDLFEFRNETSESVQSASSATETKEENQSTTDNSGGKSNQSTAIVSTQKLKTKRSEVDLFTFLSEMDDEEDSSDAENDLSQILLKTSLQPTLLFNPNKMLLDVVIVELADIKIKECKLLARYSLRAINRRYLTLG